MHPAAPRSLHTAAEVSGLVARPLPLGEMARVVAQLGCDRVSRLACTSTCLGEISPSQLSEVSMSLWIRLCNHMYMPRLLHSGPQLLVLYRSKYRPNWWTQHVPQTMAATGQNIIVSGPNCLFAESC